MLVWGPRTRRPWGRSRAANGFGGGFGQLSGMVFLVALLALTVTPQRAYADGSAVIDTDVLNLRTDPGTWAAILDRMGQGAAVTVLDGPTADGWYKVDYNGEVGWAYGGYLAINGASGWDGGASAASVGGGSGQTAWVATGRLNARSGASRGADVVAVLTQGASVTVTGGAVNGYLPVSADGANAWVWADYLTYDGPVQAGPEHWIDIARNSRTVTLYVGSEAIASFPASIGYDQTADGFYATAIGEYQVYSKYEGLTWTDWGRAYIRDWVGFDPNRVNGFHAYSMDANGNVLPWGDGATGGCVATAPWAAKQIFDFASVGMRVVVHW